MSDSAKARSTRRTFLRRSASAAAVSALGAWRGVPAVIAGPGHTQTLRVGLIGCGGRGTGAAAQALAADRNVELAAMGDLFEGRIESSLALLRKEAPGKVKVERDRCFLGFDACQKVLQSGVDVVLLATPPAFRPQHLAAAVAAGSHVFAEITAAVDAPGVRSVLRSAEVARQKTLAIVSGFCWRYDRSLRAACEQIRKGAIGEIRALYATYLRGDLSHKYSGPRKPGTSDLAWQLRDWYDYLWLSGDTTIVCSGGHSVDKMSWWLGDVMPIKAVATGSRVYPGDGNTFDNCFVAYEYASGIRGFLACRSQPGCYTENADHIVGAKGICTIHHGRAPIIRGENSWRYSGPKCNMYQTEHDELFASIRAGKPINDGTRMAHTTLMAILGRMAAYTGQEVTWEQAINSQQSLVPEKLDWSTKIETPPTARPGLTKVL